MTKPIRATRPFDTRVASAAFAALALAAAAAPAQAADVFGSAGIFTNRGCAASNDSCVVLDGDGNPTFTGGRLQPNQFYGGYGSAFSASSSLLNGASTAAQVSFGGDYLPTVRVASQSGAETRTGSSVTSFRSFTYTGDVAIDLAIQGQLHFLSSGDIAGPWPTNEFTGDGTLNVVLALLRVSTVAAAYNASTDVVDIISNSAINFPDCGADGVIATANFNSQGFAAGEYNQAVGLSQACGGGGILMNPGDSFVVIATLQAISNRGGFVNAMNTFTVQYDEEKTFLAGTTQSVGDGFLQRNIALGAAVPEPGSWALMIGGFGLAGSVLRRRRAGLA